MWLETFIAFLVITIMAEGGHGNFSLHHHVAQAAVIFPVTVLSFRAELIFRQLLIDDLPTGNGGAHAVTASV